MLEYRHTTGNEDEATANHTKREPGGPTRSTEQSVQRVVYHADEDQALSTAVAFAVAERRGVDPVSLAGDTVLGETMDLGLLDDLRTESADDADWTFEFTLPAERVSVESGGRITVTATED